MVICLFLYFQSFTTLVNNALRVAAINSVGDFILFLGKIGVMCATAAVGILWFKVRASINKTCHRDRIARLSVPCPSHKNLNIRARLFKALLA